MAAVAATGLDEVGVGRPFRAAVLVLVAGFFLIPVLASARYSLLGTHGHITLSAYRSLFADPNFWASLWLSFKIAVGSMLLTAALVVPTSIWVNSRSPRLARAMDAISLLPLGVPSVVVVLGFLGAYHGLLSILLSSPLILVPIYAMLALPYSYRTFDTAVRALQVGPLTDAAHSLGAGWIATTLHVLLPNLRVGLLGSLILSGAYALGEFVVASLLSFNTFPVYIVQIGLTAAAEAVAVSLVALLIAFLPLSVITLAGRGGSKGVV